MLRAAWPPRNSGSTSALLAYRAANRCLFLLLFLGSAFEVFWFFAFFEPPGRAVKTSPGAQKGAPYPKPRSLDAVRNLATNPKNQKTSSLRPSKARPSDAYACGASVWRRDSQVGSFATLEIPRESCIVKFFVFVASSDAQRVARPSRLHSCLVFLASE